MSQGADRLAETLRKMFGDQMATPEKIELVRGLAVDELKDWLSGNYRPDSITEINFDRVIKISLIMTGKYPEIDDLTFSFNLAPGQAQYIASRMRYKDYPSLRQLAWRSILGKLQKAKETQAGQATVTIVLDDWELKELQLLEKRKVIPHRNDYSPLERRLRFGGYAWTCNMLGDSLDVLIGELEGMLGMQHQ
jgi:hypothetical protein